MGNDTARFSNHCLRSLQRRKSSLWEPQRQIAGKAWVIHQNDPEWPALFTYFDPLPGARQIFDLSIKLVQTSCGMGVPYLSFVGERPLLADWAARKDDAALLPILGRKKPGEHRQHSHPQHRKEYLAMMEYDR
jgi:hypothetical protein